LANSAPWLVARNDDDVTVPEWVILHELYGGQAIGQLRAQRVSASRAGRLAN
jgi:hypothetical protein